eukprot:TRINITY_DN3202_c1_g1_i9.p1 TRINITY_DN3202_c1_g1~~TRINITY_DN3202_c1_g1_i9.p1  ORF type:complete len:310 (+),score=15.70 TRINITY_DN3202_c1_g1_i9:104-931(+)
MRINEHELIFLACLLNAIPTTNKYNLELLHGCSHRVKTFLSISYNSLNARFASPCEKMYKKYPIIETEIQKVTPKTINKIYTSLTQIEHSNTEDLQMVVEEIFHREASGLKTLYCEKIKPPLKKSIGSAFIPYKQIIHKQYILIMERKKWKPCFHIINTPDNSTVENDIKEIMKYITERDGKKPAEDPEKLIKNPSPKKQHFPRFLHHIQMNIEKLDLFLSGDEPNTDPNDLSLVDKESFSPHEFQVTIPHYFDSRNDIVSNRNECKQQNPQQFQ